MDCAATVGEPVCYSIACVFLSIRVAIVLILTDAQFSYECNKNKKQYAISLRCTVANQNALKKVACNYCLLNI